MLKILFFLVSLLTFSFPTNLFTPLFPTGEKLKKYIVNNPSDIQESLISHNGKFIVTIEDRDSKTIKFWSIQKKKITYIKKLDSEVKFLSLFDNDKYLLYSQNKKIMLFDIKRKKIFRSINTHNSIDSLSLSTNGKYAVSTSDNHLYLYNIKKKKKIYSIDINNSIQKVKITKQNKFLVVLSKKSYIDIYDFKKAKLIKSFNLESKINDIDISSDGKKIAAISEKNITFFDIETEKITTIKPDREFDVVRFMNNDKHLVTGGWGGIYIWDIEKRKSIYSYPYTALSISLSKENKYLVSSHENNNDLLLVNLITSKVSNFNKLVSPNKALYVEPLNQIVSIDKNYGIKFWDLEKNKLDSILDFSLITDIDISEDKTLLCAATTSGYEVKIWDIRTKKEVFSFSDKNIIRISKISISKNNKFIAYLSEDIYKHTKSLKVLDLNSSKMIHVIPLSYQPNSIYFVDNDYVVLKSYKQGIDVVDINSEKIVNQLKNKKHTYISSYPRSKFYSIYNYDNGTDYIRNIVTNKRESSIKSVKSSAYTIQTHNNFMELIDSKTNKVLTSIYMQRNMAWLVIDAQKKKYYKYMDNDFLLDPISLKFISKRQPIDEKSIDIFLPKNKVTLVNNLSSPLVVHFENLSSKKLYDIKFKINDSNFSVTHETVLFLNKKKSGNIKLNIHYNNLIKQSFSKTIELEILVNGYTKKEILNVAIKKEALKEIEILKIDSTEGRFDIQIKNLTHDRLENMAVSIVYEKKIINYLSQLTIEANGTAIAKIYKGRDDFFMFKRDNLNVEISTSMAKHYKFNKEIEIIWSVWSIIILIFPLIGILGVFLILSVLYDTFYLKSYKRHKNIINMSFSELKTYRKIWERRKTFENSLDREKILKEDYLNTENFFTYSSEKKVKIISNKISEKVKIIDNDFFEMNVANSFEIDAEKILFYLPAKMSSSEIYNILQKRRNKIIILIATSESEQERLWEDEDLMKLLNIVIVSLVDLKVLLLFSNENYTILAKIIALKIDRKLISPYQTANRLNDKFKFFGRESIINRIYERELSNYLIVGARQIGKSSLLSALHRKFEERKELTCIFISLGTDPIAFALAKNLPIDNSSALEDIVEFIYSSNKQYLFFIDEFDEFVMNEKENNYKALHTLRTLSSEGRAYFIVAGFWKLFYEASFNYQSPIKNFGEMIRLGKLEPKACLSLITKPMDNLNLKYKNYQEDIQKIIYKTGQRANLIAMVCDNIVHTLAKEKFEIDSSCVDKALRSNEVLEDFNGFHNLSGDDSYKSAIDSIIGYSSIHFDKFTLKHILELFRELDFEKVMINDIKESLKRLELSYIIEKDDNNYYSYTIPLFVEKIRNDEIDLQDLVDEFRRKYQT